MGLKITVQIDTTVPSGGRIRIVNQSVTGPAGANGTNGVGVPVGGTTGQVLAKASNTNYDTQWVTDATGIPATIFDAKGDLIAATAADTASRLATGSANQVLTVDSSTATGLKWANPAARVINTDGDPGYTVYVGSIDPTVSYSPAAGDVWIEPS